MPAPYSYDLRQKAIEAVNRGERKTDVCRLLQISRNSLDLWLKREKETGDYQAIANSNKGRKTKITDEDKFRKFVRENSDKTQKQMAELWGENFNTSCLRPKPSKVRIILMKIEIRCSSKNSH